MDQFLVDTDPTNYYYYEGRVAIAIVAVNI
jgi:hypothetical protein